MPSPSLLLALVLGCSGGDEAAAPAPTPRPPTPPAEASAEPAETAKAKASGPPVDTSAPPPPTAPEGLVQLAAAGRHAAALVAAREAVAADPADAAAWRLLGQAAVGAGQVDAVLAELDQGQAEGGQAAAHHLLRADLALAAGKARAAFEAAGLAAMADADAGAGAQALAVDAGADLPRDVASARPDGAPPAVALLRLVAARDAAAAAPWRDAAAQVGGWRADLARGRALARLGDAEAALAAFEEAAGADDPRAVLAGNLGRASLVLAGGDPAKALEWSQAGAEAAAAAGDVGGAAAALALALQAGQAGLDLDGPLAAAQAVEAKATAASGGVLAPELALALGRAGLLAGQPMAVVRSLWAASMALQEEGSPLGSAVGALTAVAGREAGLDVATLAVAIEGGDSPAAAVAGITGGVRGFAPALDGLSDVDTALVLLAATEAHVPPARRLELLQAAGAAADRSGLPGLRLQAWLAAETAARAAARLDAAAAARKSALAVAAEPGDALRAEVAVRAALAGASAEVPDAAAGAWAALLASTAPPAGEDALSRGVAAWAAARTLAAQGKGTEAAKGYLDALALVPTHRFGRLSLGTALDGSQGLPVETELSMGPGLDVQAGPQVVLAAHELLHRVRDVDHQVSLGRGLVDGVALEPASAVLGTAARARAEVARWLLGGAAPDLEAVTAAEASLAEERAVSRLLPTEAATAVAVATDDAGTALISVVKVGDHLRAAVLSGRGFAQQDLGPVAKVEAVMSRHGDALRSRAEASRSGNAVRQLLLDPFTEQLAGVPRFIIVAPAALQAFSVAAVPEQDDALRWLEDIRDVSVAPTISALTRPEVEPEPYLPDLLAFGPPSPPAPEDSEKAEPEGGARKAAAEKGKKELGLGEREPLPGEIDRGSYAGLSDLPPELAVAVRTYSRGTRQLVVGDDALLPTWEAGAATARVVQISQVELAPGGGFVLGDGTLTLGDIRATPMLADLVLITASAPTEIQLARAQAFLDAGARTVVVSAWDSAAPDLERYVSGLYDAMNQERPVIRAMEQARLAVRNDPLRKSTNTHPGVWGSWLMVGRP